MSCPPYRYDAVTADGNSYLGLYSAKFAATSAGVLAGETDILWPGSSTEASAVS
jgi:hypothetical protein